MTPLFNVLFFPKKSRLSGNNRAIIYTRITYQGKRAEFSTSRQINSNQWSSSTGKVRGTSSEVQSINRALESIKASLFEIHDRLVREKKPLSATGIRDIFQGKEEETRMLMDIFQEHNDQMKKLIGKGFTKGTMQRYNACKEHIQNFLLYRYKKKDLPVKNVDYNFITGFEHYLKFKKSCAHNTTHKYIVNFKKIIRIAYANQWIEKDPFFHWKGSWKPSEREHLSEIELQKLTEKEFNIPRLELVRDIFLFCCYTGLAFADVKKLSADDIVLNISGKRWIRTKRQKTNSLSRIPLLQIPESILEKYSRDPYVKEGKGVLPVLSNQKSNSYLKEIADLCGIKKNLTTHLARHTFATTVTLSKGVPIESVGKMLGHKSLKTTQIYAKVLDEKIESDMAKLEQKESKKNRMS